MKLICTVNTELPTVEDGYISYTSGESLLDYNIVLFDPAFPDLDRITFSGGGSCFSIEASQVLKDSMSHWSTELIGALKAGKTVFFLLNEYETDSATTGYSTPRKDARTYNTYRISNYVVLPIGIGVRNSKGRHLVAADSDFKVLHDAIKDVSQYKVILRSPFGKKSLPPKTVRE